MSKQEITANREQFVVKANDLIRKTRYSLTTQQQKIILYAISKIKPEDDIDHEYELDINDLANACGMRIREGGYYYAKVKEDLIELTRRELYLMPDGVERSISWIGDIAIKEGDATVTITFNKNMRPYLFDLKEKYTQYKLQNVLSFRGKYAIRLYEIMRSYTTQRAIYAAKENEIILSVDDLRRQLDTEAYDRWVDFNRFILKPAIDEINDRAEDIHIVYYPMRAEHKRNIESVNFVITAAKASQIVKARAARREKLDHIVNGRYIAGSGTK